MATWLNDIAMRLNASTLSIGYATTTSADRTIFIENRPSTKGSWIVLYPYQGMGPEWSHGGDRAAFPRLNVLVISTAADGGHQKGLDIISALDNAYNFWGSYTTTRFYRRIVALGEPEYLGKDENGCGNFVINFQVSYGG